MQITVRISEETGEKISLVAKSMGLNRSEIARMALDQFVEKALNTGEETPYGRVKDLIGISESGVPDLGENHREHLKRKFGGSFISRPQP